MSVQKPLISIIIPVYNVEKYLSNCLDSIIEQTWTNLDIILVDDGSNDKSGEICDDYAIKDSRIRVIHKLNAGLSAARNSGLNVAKGDYVGFVDSDDWIEPTMYENLFAGFSMAENVLLTNGMIYRYDDANGKETLMRPATWKRLLPFIIDGYGFGKAMLSESSNHYVWSKLYKKEVFDWVRFREGRNDEDTFFTYELAKIIRNKSYVIVEIPNAIYHYRIRQDSICNSKERLHIIDRMATLNDIYNDSIKYWPEMTPLIDERKVASLIWFLKNSYYSDEIPIEIIKQYASCLRATKFKSALKVLNTKDLCRYMAYRYLYIFM